MPEDFRETAEVVRFGSENCGVSNDVRQGHQMIEFDGHLKSSLSRHGGAPRIASPQLDQCQA